MMSVISGHVLTTCNGLVVNKLSMRTHPDIGLMIKFFARCLMQLACFWLCNVCNGLLLIKFTIVRGNLYGIT